VAARRGGVGVDGPGRTARRLLARSIPASQVLEIQRSRLLAAAIRALDELGYADATVAQITGRARVSRRTFYELFDSREACFAEVLEKAAVLVEGELAAAGLAGLPWRERLRMGLLSILCFFDREPALARVCVVHVIAGGPKVLARREALIARLVAVVDEGRLQGGCATDCTPLTAEGVVGAALAVIHGRLTRAKREPLAGLLGELTGMIVLPYQGVGAARREQRRPVPEDVAFAGTQHPASDGHVEGDPLAGDPLAGLPMRLTYRTARVLEGVAGHAGSSNRQVADYAGIADQGQVSKLLSRLQHLGLLANRAEGHSKGEPNAWQLTTQGQLVTQNILMHMPSKVPAAS
jgi:AcrR family transcriptional regulator